MMTATEIGKELGMSARKVNLLLAEKNVIKKGDKTYHLTQAGEEYGEYYSWISGGLKHLRAIVNKY